MTLRMRQTIPGIKAVLIQREPADDMRSSYLMSFGKTTQEGRQKPTLREYVQVGLEAFERDECLYSVKPWRELAGSSQVASEQQRRLELEEAADVPMESEGGVDGGEAATKVPKSFALKTWHQCAGCEYSGRLERGATGCFPPHTDLTDADVEHGKRYVA